jgi:F-type H+-transporting ATPase subunit delta
MLVLLDAVEQIEQIYDDYSEITSEFKKQVSVDVVSAIDLDGSILDTIKKEVDSKTGLDVRIRNISDADIIGGIVIKIGDRVIDLSVKNKIEDLRNKLKAIDLRSEEFGTEN